MINTATSRWFVVQTQTNREAKAVYNLERQGFETYFPRYLKKRRHARKIDTVRAPLFPRYVFVAIDVAQQRWRSIYSTVGVTKLLCIGELPAPVPPGVVEQLKLREDDAGNIRIEKRAPFNAGDAIRVLDGVFHTCIGLYEEMTDSSRVAILLELLGRKVRVVLDVDSVAAA
jgi:transcriptional antiterminator RfaH